VELALLKKTLKEIAELIGGELDGDVDIQITGLAGIREAEAGTLSFIANEKYLRYARESKASALVVSRDLQLEGKTLVRVDDPNKAWNRLLELIRPSVVTTHGGVHSTAVVGENVELHPDVAIMAYVTVMDGASVGRGTVLYPHVYVGHQTKIGEGCVIYPGVVIRERVEIRDRVVIHPGAVVGSDGFGYQTVSGSLTKQEQLGTVVVEDDVEIGACVTIDRARFHETRIGRGSKIDNLVQIAHNVVVGCESIIVSQTGIAGSCRIGDHVIIAGQVGVAGHLTIGDNAVIAAKAGISKNIAPNDVVYGIPAGKKIEKQREIVSLRKLPELLKSFKELEERVARLEARSQSENDQGYR